MQVHPSSFRSKGRAFTLIEIMIVMAIMAIIVAMGVPSMLKAMERDQLARAVNDVVEGCKTARDRAILQGLPWAFVVTQGRELTVRALPHEKQKSDLPTTTEPATEKPESGSTMSGFPRKLGEDVVAKMEINFHPLEDESEALIRFFPNGTADEFTVVLEFKGKQRFVQVDVVTGLAQEIKPQ